jgi:hypothetical protein
MKKVNPLFIFYTVVLLLCGTIFAIILTNDKTIEVTCHDSDTAAKVETLRIRHNDLANNLAN